jgi:hypothetical protein
MTVIVRTIQDICDEWERVDKIHVYPPFSIEWAIKKPGEDKALLGVMRRATGSVAGEYTYEVWEVGT